MRGTVCELHIKAQNQEGEKKQGVGLPKIAVPSIYVNTQGVVGDYNHFRQRKKEGTPDRALLIYTTGKIMQLANHRWPFMPGHLGENITVEGIPYVAFQPESLWRMGEATLQITIAATPCSKLKHLPYIGEENIKAFCKMLEGQRGWYARVLKEGEIKKGDSIEAIVSPD